MDWQNQLQHLEDSKQWDAAIELLQTALKQNPNDKDAYLRLLYLLMNLLLEERFDRSKSPYYQQLAKQYFEESYKKFNHDAEYLFYGGSIACVARWLFGTTTEFAKEMINKAIAMEPENIIYKWDLMPIRRGPSTEEMKQYANLVLQPNSPIIEGLKSKGSLGNYFIDIMRYWSEQVLNQKVVRNDEVQSNEVAKEQ